MKFDVNEISSLIKQEIGRYKSEIDVATVGKVLEVGDGIAKIYGLENAMAGEMLDFGNDVVGEVFNLEEERVGAVIYGDYRKVKEGSQVRSTGNVLSVPVGFDMLGRVVDTLCRPIDGLGEIKAEGRRLVESNAPTISERQPVRQPLETG
ncbi:MAG: F0F1 ATP synthase subunit alpha, partial [Anaerohalosphaera sp.]|nr:F0F1 ATP synthase subunit alpha [Anaerohalosphaera sp.]